MAQVPVFLVGIFKGQVKKYSCNIKKSEEGYSVGKNHFLVTEEKADCKKEMQPMLPDL